MNSRDQNLITWSLIVLRLGELLTRAFSKEEILEGLMDCDGNKALNPDGFNINFFKNN